MRTRVSASESLSPTNTYLTPCQTAGSIFHRPPVLPYTFAWPNRLHREDQHYVGNQEETATLAVSLSSYSSLEEVSNVKESSLSFLFLQRLHQNTLSFVSSDISERYCRHIPNNGGCVSIASDNLGIEASPIRMIALVAGNLSGESPVIPLLQSSIELDHR